MRKELEERARAARNAQNGLEEDDDSRPRQFESESDITNVVEAAIEKAMKDGSFDNLQNKGRPLPSQPTSALQYVMRIMRDNNIRPPWLQLMLDIDTDTRILRGMLAAACATFFHKRPMRWNAAVTMARVRIKEINASVDTFNISRPMSMQHLFRLRLRIDDEIMRAMRSAGVNLESSEGGQSEMENGSQDSADSEKRLTTRSKVDHDRRAEQREHDIDGGKSGPPPLWRMFARFVRAEDVREYDLPTWGRRRPAEKRSSSLESAVRRTQDDRRR